MKALKRALWASAAFLFILIGQFCGLSCEAAVDDQAQRELLSAKLLAAGMDEGEIEATLSDERLTLYPEILQKKGAGINYLSRKFGLLKKKSVNRGKEILRSNRALLKKVEATYGVEKEVIVAILRLETNFGGSLGSYRVFNALLTLSVLENRRSAWAAQELGSWLAVCKRSGKDPLEIKGSWAGAFGLCQFVPSSYVQHGTDGDGDGYVDLFSFADAAVSTANYLKAYGWERTSTAKKKKALWAYNHCDEYVKAILAYARAIR